ncbi:MAG: substrate-binding domain-containing protein [Bacteroidales bacterium]|nr:substrate-binding domain-containing protein [Bacteroidales bacterium]
MCAHVCIIKKYVYICRVRTRNFKTNMIAADDKIRIKDIARLAGISAGTVDRVLHNRGEVKAETREKVLKIIKELGYTPNLLAKSLALKKTFRICVLIPSSDISNPYWEKPLAGINKAKGEIKDYSTRVEVFTYAIDNEVEFEQKLNEIILSVPDGIVFSPHFVDTSQRMLLLCNIRKIPVVFIDSNISTSEVLGYFGQNAFLSGYMAARLMSYGLPKNSRVLVLKLAKNRASFSHIIKREQGFMSFFTDNPHLSIKPEPVEIDLVDDDEPDHTLSKLFYDAGNLAGVFVTNSRVHTVVPLLKHYNLSGTLLIGYDLVEESVKYMEEGIIDFLICQKPEEQGYNCVMSLFNYLLQDKQIERMNYSPIDIVMKDNYQYHIKNINSKHE